MDRPIVLADLAVDMVLGAWFPHGFCRLSFGSGDRLQHAVDLIDWGEIRGSWIVAGGPEWRRLRERCAASLDTDSLMRFVPYRLIRPFFEAETRGLPDHEVNYIVADLSEKLFQTHKPIYCFTDDRRGIILQHDWVDYLASNVAILRGWARFHLARYLQSCNPSVPGIVEKLEPPMMRTSLARQTHWWKEALPRLPAPARCIFSGESLDPSAFSLDHYLPWSLVAHDRLWNLIPVSRSVNSAKSDRLPAPHYLEGLVRTQHAALTILREAWSNSRWNAAVEPWLVDLALSKDALLDRAKLGAAYESTITPLMLIGGRQGFVQGWEYA